MSFSMWMLCLPGQLFISSQVWNKSRAFILKNEGEKWYNYIWHALQSDWERCTLDRGSSEWAATLNDTGILFQCACDLHRNVLLCQQQSLLNRVRRHVSLSNANEKQDSWSKHCRSRRSPSTHTPARKGKAVNKNNDIEAAIDTNRDREEPDC